MRKLTRGEFILKARCVHGWKYNYSEAEYVNMKTPIKIICPNGHTFFQRPDDHLRGKGCAECYGNVTSTKEKFVQKSKQIHGNKYDYSKVIYKNRQTEVCIICPIHGEFWQTPANHLKGKGCIKCAGVERKTMEQFVLEARKIHGDKYIYHGEYINWKTEIPIECTVNNHGIFYQTPNSHLCGKGCPKCKAELSSLRQIGTLEDFIKEAKEKHGDRYTYENAIYKGCDTNLLVTCSIHGDFEITPYQHIHREQGCSKCRFCHGETKISLWLDNHNIEYVSQYTINLPTLLFQRNQIRVDFYLPNLNIVIEFHGEQHYSKNKFFHKDEDAFQMQIERDNRLRQYCKQNKIRLIEIPYTKIKEVDKILDKKIGRLK